MFDWIFSMQAWIALLSLTALEIVLGVDNILFISVLTDKLPEKKQSFARKIGLIVALAGRLVMLFMISWIMSFEQKLFSLLGHAFSAKDFILMGGGLFLLWKSTTEIHDNLEGPEHPEEDEGFVPDTLTGVILQVLLLDAVFSVDSVITAIGLVDEISIIVISMIVAMTIMIISVETIGEFIEDHPSFKMLALSFLILVGSILVCDGLGLHVPRGYIYFAMAFSASVEFLNLKMRKQKEKPIHLRKQPSAQKKHSTTSSE